MGEQHPVVFVLVAMSVVIGAIAGCGSSSEPDHRALAQARQAGYTRGFNAGMDAGERSAKEVTRRAALRAFRRGWNEGAQGVFGNFGIENGHWYAVKVEISSEQAPSLSAGLPLSEGQGYRLCVNDPTEICPVALTSSIPQNEAPA